MAATVSIVISQSGSGSAVADAKKGLEDIGGAAKDAGGGLNVFQEIGVGALRAVGEAALGLAVGGLKALGSVITDGIADARENAKIQAQTAAVIKSTGGAAGRTAQQVADYATSLSAASGKSLFGDDQIQQSENLLMTFTNISKGSLDAATSMSVDLAQAMGGAPKDSAIQLGKALNDPIKGITALTRIGVTFSDEQKDQIKVMQESGDMAGAQAVILAELNKEFGGSAEAAAKADGGMAQFKDRMGEAKEAIGTALLPLLGQLAGFLNDTIAPVVEKVAAAFGVFVKGIDIQGIAGIFTVFEDGSGVFSDFLQALGVGEGAATGISQAIGGGLNVAMSILNEIVKVLQPVFQSLVDTFTNASTPFEGILDVLSRISPSFALLRGMVEMAWPQIQALTATLRDDLMNGFTVVWDYIQANIMPILNNLATAVMPLLSATIQVLAGLWTDVLKPALITAWEIFTTFIVPILAVVAKWLAENLPPAIQAVADFMTGTLFPALHTVFDWIQTNVLPILADVVLWLQTNVPVAIQMASDFWNNVLLPAITAIWNFISVSILPIFSTLYTWLFTTLPAGIGVLAGFWNNTLLPAITAVWTFINTYIIPIFTALVNVNIALLGLALRTLEGIWKTVLLPAITSVWDFLNTYIVPIFVNIYNVVFPAVKSAMESVAFFILGTLYPQFMSIKTVLSGTVGPALETAQSAFGGVEGALSSISGAVQGVIKWLNDLASKLNSISIPDWLQGHSPPPMANWFSSISDAAQQFAKTDLPALRFGLNGMAPALGQSGIGGAGGSNSSVASSYNRSVEMNITNNLSGTEGMDYSLAASLAGI